MACAVSAIIGIAAVAAAALMRRVASQPSITGSDKSIRMRSGRSLVAFSTPAAPSAALTNWYSSSSSWVSRSRLSSTSSTMRILFMVVACSAAGGPLPRRPSSGQPPSWSSDGTDHIYGLLHRQRPLDLPDQCLAVEAMLLDETKHAFLQ